MSSLPPEGTAMKDWPIAERPRERLLTRGARALSDAELLAILLGSGTKGSNVMDLARKIQVCAQSVGGWQRLEPSDLDQVSGLGPARVASVLAALELGIRASDRQGIELGQSLTNSQMAFQACRAVIGGLPVEHFLVLSLDSRRRLLGQHVVAQGSLTQTLVHPREVMRPALRARAAAILVAHNHPSGDSQPSQDDHVVTQRVRAAADLMAIPLLDHLVLGADSYYSYADQHWSALRVAHA